MELSPRQREAVEHGYTQDRRIGEALVRKGLATRTDYRVHTGELGQGKRYVTKSHYFVIGGPQDA